MKLTKTSSYYFVPDGLIIQLSEVKLLFFTARNVLLLIIYKSECCCSVEIYTVEGKGGLIFMIQFVFKNFPLKSLMVSCYLIIMCLLRYFSAWFKIHYHFLLFLSNRIAFNINWPTWRLYIFNGQDKYRGCSNWWVAFHLFIKHNKNKGSLGCQLSQQRGCKPRSRMSFFKFIHVPFDEENPWE